MKLHESVVVNFNGFITLSKLNSVDWIFFWETRYHQNYILSSIWNSVKVEEKHHCDEIKYSDTIWEDLYVIWIHFLLVYPRTNTMFILHHHSQIGLCTIYIRCLLRLTLLQSREFDSEDPSDDLIRDYKMETIITRQHKSFPGEFAIRLAMKFENPFDDPMCFNQPSQPYFLSSNLLTC